MQNLEILTVVNFVTSETVKESIRKTANEFLSVMPLFSQRLAQRDYDLILVSPMKRRMLLKMYCMGESKNSYDHQ